MKVVAFPEIIIENFRSFTARSTIELPLEPGLRFIAGRNMSEPALGSNGAGKSSLWDALVWALYGQSVRGQRAADLASWGSSKRPHVTVTALVGNEVHTIDRTGSPDVLLLDDQHVGQDTIDRLVGLSRQCFVQSVIFGQSAPLFMDLSIPDRAALMDEVMSLGIWLELSDHAGHEVAQIRDVGFALTQTLEKDKAKLKVLQEQTEPLRRMITDFEDRRQQRLRILDKELLGLVEEIEAADKDWARTDHELSYIKLRTAGTPQRCPACGQDIVDKNVQTRQRELASRLIILKEQIAGRTKAVKRLSEQVDAVRKEEDTGVLDMLAKIEQQCADTGERIAAAEPRITELQKLQAETGFWKQGFRQVRLWQVNRILTMFEIETAAAAAQLGVGDWQVKFATETETKSGTVRPGIHVNVTNPARRGDYKSYSFGEAQRIKLAISLGLSALIQALAGVCHTLQVFDEPTAWLSVEGIDDLLKCLHDRSREHELSIWLLDHRSMTFPFDGTYMVVKEHAGSSVQQLA